MCMVFLKWLFKKNTGLFQILKSGVLCQFLVWEGRENPGGLFPGCSLISLVRSVKLSFIFLQGEYFQRILDNLKK